MLKSSLNWTSTIYSQQIFFLILAFSSAILTEAHTNIVQHGECFRPDFTLRVTAQTISKACVHRDSVVVNGTSPGPLLRLIAGKTTWIRVYNDVADQNLTMHWHGLSLAASPFSDGAPQASQWPIPPGHFFDYELHPEKSEAGTYFYHSHVGFQGSTAAGALIVDDIEDAPYYYDEERVLFLSDLFNKTDTQIEHGLTSNPFVWSGEIQALLVNGFGRTDNTTAGSTSCSLATFNVKPDKIYRFRVIGALALSFVTLAFEGHEMTIIEADGQYTKPLSTNYLQIGSGERYSVLIKAKTKQQLREENRQEFLLQLETRERPALTHSYALLRYSEDATPYSFFPAAPPLVLPNTTFGWLEYQLRPLIPNDFPTSKEVTRRVTIRVQQILDGSITWTQNGLPWTEYFPQTPYLVALYLNDTIALPSYSDAIANGGMDPRVRAFPAKLGEVLEIVIQNSGATNGALDVHPFHAHGAHFYDIGSGNGTYNATENDAILQTTEPVRRDTTMLYRYAESTLPGADAGWRAWRLRVTQPGVWMIHCHTLQHMIMGMQTAWVFGDTKDLLKVPAPKVEGYLSYGGSAYGNSSHWPRAVHFKEPHPDDAGAPGSCPTISSVPRI